MKRTELFERLEAEWMAYGHLKTTAGWKKRYGSSDPADSMDIWAQPDACAGSFCERVPDGRRIKTFHASAAVMLKAADEYFCGIRADHFIVEFGWSEDYDGIAGNAREDERACVIVTANHKGTRICTWFPVFDKALIAWFDALDRAEPVAYPSDSVNVCREDAVGLERLDRELALGDLSGFLDALDARLAELGIDPETQGLPAEYRSQFMSNPASADLETLVKLLDCCGRRLLTADAAGCRRSEED